MTFFLIELWSTENPSTVPFDEISLCSSFVKSCDMLSKQKLYHDCNWIRTHNHLVHKRTLNHLAKLASQKLYQLMLSFALNLQISVLFTYR